MTHIKTVLISVAAIFCIALIGLYAYTSSKQLQIEFFENAEVDVNEAVDNYQFVKSIENGTILTEKKPVDTASVGEKNICLTVKPVFGREKVFVYSIVVVDRESPGITYADHLEADLGDEIDLFEGVRAADNSGEEITVTVEGSYDFNAIGDYKLKYVAVDSSLNRAEGEFILSVVDRESPEIKFTDHLETTEGKKIDLLAGVSASDNSGEEITVTVEGSYDINKPGEYKLKYVACDSSLNRAEAEFTLKVKEAVKEATPTTQNNDGKNDTNAGNKNDTNKSEEVTFTTSKGFSGVVKDGVTYIDGYLIANKTYSLPKSYGNGLTSEFNSAFKKMQTAAKEDGISIYIVSGFRSYNTQNTIYNNYVKRDGKEKADTYSARPGHSEHQAGLAADLNTASSSDHFENSKEFAWLNSNCYKYGFILRYINGKTNETGYKFEPWHYRYV